MLERAAFLILTAFLVVALILVWRALQARRLAHMRAGDADPLWSTLGERPDGRPALVVFSSPGCAACHTAQLPSVEAVSSQFGNALRVMNVDIAQQPEVSRAFGVMTAPSTVVLAGDGRVGSV